MFIIRLLRWLRGYLSFRVAEGFPERFLNLCRQAGIAVWDLSWRADGMEGRTDLRGFLAMASCAEAAGCSLEERRRCGLPFFLKNMRVRAGLLAGCLFFVAALYGLSTVVWTIEITGNVRVLDEEILAVLEGFGVKPGVPHRGIRAKELSVATQKALPGVSWLAINLRGTTMVIELRETLETTPRASEEPQDLIAAKDGQIVDLVCYAGEKHVRVGDVVSAGDVLIGGLVTLADGSLRAVAATGSVTARTEIFLRAIAPRTESSLKLTRIRKHWTVGVLWWRIPLGRPLSPKNPNQFRDRSQWHTVLGRGLPLWVERTTLYETQATERHRSDTQLRLRAAERFFRSYQTQLQHVTVLEERIQTELSESGGCIELAGHALEELSVASMGELHAPALDPDLE